MKNLFDLAAIESNSFRLNLTHFNPKLEFLKVIEVYQTKLAQKKVSLQLQLERVNCYLNSDKSRLIQLFTAIFSHILKYSLKSTVTVEAKLKIGDDTVSDLNIEDE